MNPASNAIAWDPDTQTYYNPSTGEDLTITDAQITSLIQQQHVLGFSVIGVDTNVSGSTARNIGTVTVAFSKTNWLLWFAIAAGAYFIFSEDKS